MPTTNPVPSRDPSDLLFNAGKLDEVVSGSNATYTDRFGISRRTIAGIDAAADLVLSGLGYAPPVAYASGIALTLTTQTVEYAGEVYAPKVANLPFTTSGTFETAKFRLIQGVASADLPALAGQDLQDYAALRAYTGRAKRIYITGLLVTAKPAGISGVFQHDPTDTTSADNGGTIIVDASGRRWKRDFSGEVNLRWFGATGSAVSNDTAAFKLAFATDYKNFYAPAGHYVTSENLTTAVNVSLRGDGDETVIDGRSIPTTGASVISQSGSVASSTLLTADVAIGAKTIPVASASGISIGSCLLIRSTLNNSWSGTWGAAKRTYRKQSFFKVIAISGNVLTLNEETNTTFEAASTSVDVLAPTTAKFSDFKVLAFGANESKGVNVTYGLNFTFERVNVEGGDVSGLGNTSSINTVYDNCNVNLNAAATSYQYGIAVSSSDLTFIINPNINATRHAVAIVGDQCRRTRVIGGKLKGSYAPDAHGCADDYSYEDCYIEGFYGLKVGGRNGSWKNCAVVCENGTIIGAYEVYGGTFTFDGTKITSYASVTADVGWSPIDLGRGTAAISPDSRADITFRFKNGCVFNLPNLATYFMRVGNSSPYKVNFDIDGSTIINCPGMVSVLRYEGNPTGPDADFVTIGEIIHNATVSPLPYFQQGAGASGYATTQVKLPAYRKNGNYGFGTQSPESKVHIADNGGGLKLNGFGYLTSSDASPFITELKTVGTSSSLGQVNITANARYGDIRFRTGFDGSALPLADRVVIESPGHTRPGGDNTQTLGSSSSRWSVVYSGTGTINTSDEREKQDVAQLDEAEKRVAVALKGLVRKFRFKDAVLEKEADARVHIGVIAQDVKAAFEAEGLNPFAYALLCYDEWPELQQVVDAWDDEYDDAGNLIRKAGSQIVQEYRPAGNRYGVRYEELLAFIIAAL